MRMLQVLAVCVAGCSLGCSSIALAEAVHFGSVKLGKRTKASVKILIPYATRLSAISVRTEGAENLDFTNVGKEAAGQPDFMLPAVSARFECPSAQNMLGLDTALWFWQTTRDW